jgi:hypothetical protein
LAFYSNCDDERRQLLAGGSAGSQDIEDEPNEDYAQIGNFWAAILSTLRVALGDFDFGASLYL